MRRSRRVSIPFIAGQWSLLVAFIILSMIAFWFQSPSLRGSGRFWRAWQAEGLARKEFQSPSLRGSGRFAAVGSVSSADPTFQSPSLRGSGRFVRRRRMGDAGGVVSIPFIAGQWSLLGVPNIPHGQEGRFNPLHCGAVVASARQRRYEMSHITSFNPLHCGAVVASGGRPRRPLPPLVSIPFIAGQWSLL